MNKGAVQIEAHKKIGPLARIAIRKMAQVWGLDVDFVPWGKEGDMLMRPFGCRRCHNVFTGSVSMCNEEIVVCPRCQIAYMTRNNAYEAWIVTEADDSDLKRHYMYFDASGNIQRDGWHLV